MEIEPSAPQIAGKKLWNIVRIMFYMLRKGMLKSKLMQITLQDMLKRGKIVGKAISNLMLHPPHYSSSSFTCKSNNNNDVAMSFITRREYEFSCSNSPKFPLYFANNKRRRNRTYKSGEIDVVQKVFEILNTTSTSYEAGGTTSIAVASPLALLGFGKSPNNVRKLRVTDSPFPIKDSEENYNSQVDKDAEEFIKKFYKDLKQQKKIASLESPSPYHVYAR
ncbi:hypothetical protein H5410_059451 [Solanum commersonii]|uniref:Avr9/Cf-9 rapidly elicited protein 146 n=1 Tax=Solanum commersonii TaxID=4109 RepID=A0A9J5W2H1_SOLCO|nr:hypothetical protein H5410_059451 [Solanum commersonii]